MSIGRLHQEHKHCTKVLPQLVFSTIKLMTRKAVSLISMKFMALPKTSIIKRQILKLLMQDLQEDLMVQRQNLEKD